MLEDRWGWVVVCLWQGLRPPVSGVGVELEAVLGLEVDLVVDFGREGWCMAGGSLNPAGSGCAFKGVTVR